MTSKPTSIDRSSRSPAALPIVKQSLLIAALAIGNAALAMLMPWYVVLNVGVSAETDAFFASGALPQFVFLVLTATLLPVLVPLLATSDNFQNDAGSFVSLTVAVFLTVAVVLFLSSSLWVPLLVPGFAPAGKALTITLTRIQLVSMVLNAVIVCVWAAHHVRQRFVWVEATGMIANCAGLLFLVLTLKRFGIAAAAWNTVFYNSLKLVFLLPILGGGFKVIWRSNATATAWKRLKPLLPGHIYLRTEPLVDRFLTSMTGAGTLSMLYMSQQVYASANLLLGKAVVAPMVPRLATDARAADWTGFRRIYRHRAVAVLFVSGIGCAVVLAGRHFLGVIVGHGGITPQNVNRLWLVMVAMSGGFVGGVLTQVATGAFYATGDTKTPTKISAILYTIYLPLKVLGFLMYGVIGLASAMSAYALTNAGLQFLALRRKTALNAPPQSEISAPHSSLILQQE